MKSDGSVALLGESGGDQRGYGAAAVEFVSNPVGDLAGVKDELISISDFWADMRKRERTFFHQSTLVLGVVLAVTIVAYCITLKTDPRTHVESTVFSDYLAVELGIVGIAQLFFSFRGICLENSPMLLIANVNAIGLSIRIGLSVHLQLLSQTADILFLVLVNIFTVLHLVTSYVAWGGEFTRYIAFVIGTNGEIQLLYRQYQLLLLAISFMDLEFLAMSCATLYFFTEVVWWHYVVVSALLLFSLGLRSALRVAVRRETLWSLFVLIPLLLVAPVMLGLGTYYSEFFDATIPVSCRNIATFIIVWFFVVRVALLVAIVRCRMNFGHGLKDAFESEKTVRGYFAHRKARSLDAFMARARHHNVEADGDEES